MDGCWGRSSIVTGAGPRRGVRQRRDDPSLELCWRSVGNVKHLKERNTEIIWRSLFPRPWEWSEVYLKYEERHRRQTVHFSLRTEGKHGDNLQTSKGLLQSQRQCGIAIHPPLLGQELMGLCFLKKKISQGVSVEKGIRKYFLRERIVKCGKWLPEDGEDWCWSF